jgi:hypothetical protein
LAPIEGWNLESTLCCARHKFDFVRNPKVSAQRIRELSNGDYIAKAQPVIFIGGYPLSRSQTEHLVTKF